MRSLITEMRMSVSKPHLDDNLSKAARMFGHAIDQLEQTTEDILSRCKNSSGLAQAIASPYLRQTSICAAGWLMFRSLEKLTDSDIEEGFAKAKGLSCNFLLAQIVPEADFMAQQIANTRHELLHETAPLF